MGRLDGSVCSGWMVEKSACKRQQGQGGGSRACVHTSCCLVLQPMLYAVPCCVLCCLSPPQGGQAPLSDLQCTTSSEALLAGKAPTFRLLVWAIDRNTGGSRRRGRAAEPQACVCV